jgi:SAM-dependent methyltransferase
VIATEFAPEFLAQAQARCAHLPNVEVLQANLGDGAPPGSFDLILLSDFGCHFMPRPLIEIVLRMVAQLQAGGELVAAHSLLFGPHLLYGDTVHNLLSEQLPLEWTHSARHDAFRIDVWRRL